MGGMKLNLDGLVKTQGIRTTRAILAALIVANDSNRLDVDRRFGLDVTQDIWSCSKAVAKAVRELVHVLGVSEFVALSYILVDMPRRDRGVSRIRLSF